MPHVHTFVTLANLYHVPLRRNDDAEDASHTAFVLMACVECGEITGFPESNFDLLDGDVRAEVSGVARKLLTWQMAIR